MSADSSRSLFRRLLLGFVAVMLGIWLCALAWDMIETRTNSRIETRQEMKGMSRQILVFMQTIADRPDEMAHVVKRLEQVREALYQERGLYPELLHIQVWKGRQLVYSSALSKEDADSWVSWSESDPVSGITVRVAQEVVGQWIFTISSLGYYFLPLLYSLPFLLIPTWFIVKTGLRPLKKVGAEIEIRSSSDLSPLQASPYRELSPVVNSVNRLMRRLEERLGREQEFLIDAAHELKTPMSVIQVNADALLNEPTPAQVVAANNGLRLGVARATHTVHQLLALARSANDHAQSRSQVLDLVALVRDRLALAAQIALAREIDIELRSPEQCLLLLQRESAASLIDNLIDNAVKYSPGKSIITVEIQETPERVSLTVNDQGPGIPSALRKKVFERFYRIPGQEQEGSGLGLAIVERAAARNQASVRLETASGGGLSAIVEFRAYRRPAALPEEYPPQKT